MLKFCTMNNLLILFDKQDYKPKFILLTEKSGPEALAKIFGQTLNRHNDDVSNWVMSVWENNSEVLGHFLFEDLRKNDIKRIKLDWEKKLGMSLGKKKTGKESKSYAEFSKSLKKTYAN